MPVKITGTEGKQLRITIPQSVAEIYGLKKGDKVRLEAKGKDQMLLTVLRE